MLKLLKPIEQIDTNKKKDIIINNIMKSKSVYLLVSNPKVGKSMLALQLSCSIINGTPFLGYKVNLSPVLYVTTESDKIQLKERLEFMELSTKKDSLFIIDRQNKANKKYVKLQTINKDFSEIDIQLKKLDNLIFRKINSIEEDELSFELTSFVKYVARQKEIDFTCTDIVLKANIPMSPKRFGRLLNNSIELLESESVHITKCRTADSRLYHK